MSVRTTRKTPEIPPARGRRAKLQAEAPDLAGLVDEKRLTLPEAEAASLQRARIRLERERRNAGPQPGDIWLRNNLPVPETTEDEIIYLLYVLAHSRNLAADVKYGRWPLWEAVFSVNERCPFPCEEHHPLSAGLIEAFTGLYAGDPEKTGEARDVVDYAPDLVPGIKCRGGSARRPRITVRCERPRQSSGGGASLRSAT